ncbi:acetolactate synthase small subunit [Demequina capsici]|uniref:Acetolactate synthase small subunit n=1 Tax=Demequina capsici TaxID=3075620 RepID=A0AA96F956_9MICO|nr:MULTISPECIES: acetolactate synthase small subunit [unclassified Demequina]WNM23657.1 acetolactate synthase small subunit [Demequina sp. OYTSA14]WNM26496.1 acetolactate synthase small subunit [Demequina sp. PMTSA13]
MTTHTLSVLVENKPGVLARVAGLFSRRAFNIHSLAVGQTEHPEISRITVVVDVDELPLEQVTKQLNKLVHVLKIVELERDRSVQRDLLLIKVRADARQRADVLQIVDLFRAHVVDVAPDSVVIEAVGTSEKLQALLAALSPHDVREIVQSGTVAIGRGSRSITERALERVGATA